MYYSSMDPCLEQGNGPALVPKICGADIELGNYISGRATNWSTGPEASRLVLAAVDGVPYCGEWRSGSYWSSWGGGSGGWAGQGSGWSTGSGQWGLEWGRKFLPTNGGSVYIDMHHLEVCLPELRSAFDHVACWHAMLRIVRQAMHRAGRSLPRGQRLEILVNNSDGFGHSYGSHLDFLLARSAWDRLFSDQFLDLLFLASFQVSSIIVTGQGKVGSENGRPWARYQISQRADFMEQLTSLQTTHQRGIVNSRDEALCGARGNRWGNGSDADRSDGYARLHCIFYDNTLCEVASLLKVGLMQIILALMEAGQSDVNLIVRDPVKALQLWSRDLMLKRRVRLANGRWRTALELQWEFFRLAERFVDRGGCDGIVPQARAILRLWAGTLSGLAARDFDLLARRLDWVLKLCILQRARAQDRRLTWDSDKLKCLDHLYGNLDSDRGLFWAYQQGGAIEQVVAEKHIRRFMHSPPRDTRAWTRAMLLRRAGPEHIDSIDWDSIRLRLPGYDDWYYNYVTVPMPDPGRMGRSQTRRVFDCTDDLCELAEELRALAEPPSAGPSEPPADTASTRCQNDELKSTALVPVENNPDPVR